MPDPKYTSQAEIERQQLMKGVTDSGDKLAELLGARAKQQMVGEQAMAMEAEKARLGQEASARNTQQLRSFLKPGESGSMDETGNVALHTADPLTALLKKSRNDDLRRQQLSKQVAQQNIPETEQALTGMVTSVSEGGLSPNVASRLLGNKGSSTVLEWAPRIAKKLGINPEAVTQQRGFDQAMSQIRKSLAGTAVTPTELKYVQDAYDMYATGTEEQKVQAMNTLIDMHNAKKKNVRGGYDKDVKSSYAAEGGVNLEDTPRIAYQKKKDRIAALRAKGNK